MQNVVVPWFHELIQGFFDHLPQIDNGPYHDYYEEENRKSSANLPNLWYGVYFGVVEASSSSKPRPSLYISAA